MSTETTTAQQPEPTREQAAVLREVARQTEELDLALQTVIQRATQARKDLRLGRNVAQGHMTILHGAPGDVTKAEGKVAGLLLMASVLQVDDATLLAAYTSELRDL